MNNLLQNGEISKNGKIFYLENGSTVNELEGQNSEPAGSIITATEMPNNKKVLYPMYCIEACIQLIQQKLT